MHFSIDIRFVDLEPLEEDGPRRTFYRGAIRRFYLPTDRGNNREGEILGIESPIIDEWGIGNPFGVPKRITDPFTALLVLLDVLQSVVKECQEKEAGGES